MAESKTLVVTGASGYLGRLVIEALLNAGEKRVIGTTRRPGALADLAKRGVEIRAADFCKPEGLPEAFEGATHVLIISTNEVGSRVDAHRAAIEAAKKAGAKHIVYTSHAAADTSVSYVAPEHALTEKIIRECGLKYTILRNFLYPENLLLSLPIALKVGAIHGATGDARTAWVTRRDCADAAAGALRNAEDHENKTYDVTGPKAYSQADLAMIVSNVVGREIPYVNHSLSDFREKLLGDGLPPKFVDVYMSFEESASTGELDVVTDVVQKLSGHAPETLESYLQKSLLSATDYPETLNWLRDHLR
jgi:NAD(P)H dehydrogenase (quinone)